MISDVCWELMCSAKSGHKGGGFFAKRSQLMFSNVQPTHLH